jgi:hypothetical protein
MSGLVHLALEDYIKRELRSPKLSSKYELERMKVGNDVSLITRRRKPRKKASSNVELLAVQEN